MLTPAAWISNVAWPTIVTRGPAIRASGLTGITGTDFGHLAAPPASFHRSIADRPRSVEGWPGLKKRTPSKWSLGGPW